jgi:4-alpha-glucanotransferase
VADAWGIEPGWEDVHGDWHDAADATRSALRVAMGGLPDLDDPPPRTRPVWFVTAGDSPAVERPCDLVLEDGTAVAATRTLPPNLPLGYHDLHPDDGGTVTRLIVVPERCHPAPVKAWGWAAQLYAARSRASWGVGDLADLATLGRWAAADGASFLAVSPLHAPLPIDHQEPSPYFASSRRWRSPLLVRVEDVAGFDPDDPTLAAAAAAGRALAADRRIDRDRVWALKRAALDHLATTTPALAEPAFTSWRRAEGRPLARYAAFCALAEHYGTGWRSWPAEHRRPDAPGVTRFVAKHAERVTVHAWHQWLVESQLAVAVDQGVAVIHDLAIGCDPAGADAWLWQDCLADGVRVGAPPDEFSAGGQDWGLPPFVPWKLRAAGYEPLAAVLRAALAHGGGLRVDHVMGLFRLFWIPDGAVAADGGYVRYPGTELLDVLALESVRAGAFVVGEDLGTVEEVVREQLAARDVLSYRLAWFEPGPPTSYPERAFAAVTTHDLPTVAGVWTSVDPDADRVRPRLEALVDEPGDASVPDVVVRLHRRLADAPSRLVSATLDDALAVPERPNVPGSGERAENWNLALPVPIDDLAEHPLVAAVADALRAHVR